MIRQTTLILYLALVAVAWLVNWPGRLNPDSYDMLTQARDISTLTDWHAPIITWLWSLFTPALGQPAGALLMQALLIFAYPVMVLTSSSSKESLGFVGIVHWVGWVVCLLALIAATGHVLKDHMLVGFILCFLTTLHLMEAPSGRTPSIVLLCATFALLILLVRPTNFVLLATAGCFLALLAFKKRRTLLSALAIIALACVISVPVTQWVNKIVLGASSRTAERSLVIFDVAGISTQTKQDLFAELKDWPSGQVPRPWECYTPVAWDPFAWGPCKQYGELFGSRMQQEGTGRLVRWWIGSVLRHPFAYLRHRLSYTMELLGSPTWVVEPTRTPRATNAPQSEFDIRGFQIWQPVVAYSPFSFVADLVFSRLALFLALLACAGTLLLAWYYRRIGEDTVAVASAAIGVGNVLMLIPFGVAIDGRYLLPTTVCGAVAVLRLIRTCCASPD